MNTTEVLGQRIKHYRTIHSLTQKELAGELGVAPLYISEIEQGKRGMSIEKLVEICKRFNVSTSDILPIERDDSKAKEAIISNISLALRGWDIERIMLLEAMICKSVR